MTEERAREILQEYRETDEETGQTYGLTVKRCLSTEGRSSCFCASWREIPTRKWSMPL